MEILTISNRYIVFVLPKGINISKDDAAQTIQRLLRENNIPQWSSICIDIFSGDDCLLCFAYPKIELKITIAPYALPLLGEYFTE